MRKWMILLLSLTMVFHVPLAAFGETKENYEIPQLDETLEKLEDGINSLEKDVDKQLIHLHEMLDEAEVMINEEIEETIDKERRFDSWKDQREIRRQKIKKIFGVIIEKVELEAKLIQNTREVKNLVQEINTIKKEVAKEVKDIVSADKSLTKEQFDDIQKVLPELRRDLSKVAAVSANLTKEVAIFTKSIAGKQFIEAYDSFNKILALQQQQINELNILKQSLEDLLVCLKG